MFILNIIFTKKFLHRVLREIENIRHDASLLKEQMTLVKEDIRVVKMMIFFAYDIFNFQLFNHN